MIKTLKKYSILVLSIVVFLPTVVQLVHVFEKHEHTICVSESDQHFHQKDLDCVLCHLQGETYGIITENYEVIFNKEQPASVSKKYNFLSNYQQLSFSLRGPPFSNLT